LSNFCFGGLSVVPKLPNLIGPGRGNREKSGIRPFEDMMIGGPVELSIDGFED
jgi:hypothetical protein